MYKESLPINRKEVVINLLARSFDKNQSVNYIIKHDKARQRRIEHLMEYSYKMCSRFGKIILSDDETACALLLYPDRKKIMIQSVVWDIQLIFRCMGIKKILSTLKRESLIKQVQPKELMTYIWFIGVDPQEQNKGKGSLLLKAILEESKEMNRIVCLETSTLKNLPWYQKFGFKIYCVKDMGYKLYFLSKAFKE